MRHRLLIAIMLILPLCQGVLGKAKGEIAPASFAAGTDSSGAPAGQLGGNNALEWINRINLSGTLQGEARWMKYPGASYPESKSTSDLYLRIFELGIETNFLDWASGIAVLNSEWIGDYLNMGDEKLTVDEVHGDLRRDSLPFYLVFGKRTQPFGVFENHLVTDPMTQDAYETKKVGATVGVTGGMGLDVSVTLYKGDEQMGHLFQSGLFDTTVIIRNADPVRNVESYIGAVSLAPVNQLITMFGAYLSEPGHVTRNATMNLGINLVVPFFKNLTVDGEYIKALRREKYGTMDHEFREGVLSATVAYSIIFRQSSVKSRGLYRARRLFTKTHPMEVAFRYEGFDDAALADRFQTWSVKNRYSFGGRYTAYEKDPVVVYFVLEYRGTQYRLAPEQRATLDEFNNEVRLRLGLDY